MLYELLLGGVLTATLVPQFVRHVEREDDEAVSAIITVAMFVLVAVSIAGVLAGALHRPAVHVAGRRARAEPRSRRSRRTLVRLFMPQIALLRVHGARDRAVERAPSVRGSRVRPHAQQHRRHRDLRVTARVCVDGPITLDRVRDDTALVLTLGSARLPASPRWRSRCCGGPAAGADPAPVRVRVAASRRRRDGCASPAWTRRLRDREPDRALDRARPRQRHATAGRSST